MKHVCFAAVACCLFVLFQGVSLAHPDDPPSKTEKKPLTDLKPKFTISKETTYVLGPVKADGYIDYIEALNDLCSKGVTIENNACILLFRALGPEPSGYRLPPEYYKRLGITEPPEKGDYFVPWDKFFNVPEKDEATREKSHTLRDRVANRLWSAAEFPKVADWLKVNDKAVELTIEASRRSRFYSPYYFYSNASDEPSGLMGVSLPMIMIHDAGTSLLARAMLRAKQGKFNEASKDLLACHQLGRLVAQGGTVIERLTGLSLDAMALDADLALISDDRVGAPDLRRFQTEVRNLPLFPPVMEAIDKAERMQCLDFTFLVARYGTTFLERMFQIRGEEHEPGLAAKVANNLLFSNLHWDPTLKEINAWFDRLIAIMKIEDAAKRLSELHRLDEDFRKERLEFSSNIGGKLMETASKSEDRARWLGQISRILTTPASVKVQQAADMRDQQHRNLQVAIALELYRRAHQRYPAKLAELSPAYLKAIPNDMFTSQDLIYRKTDKGYLLYSVGPNGKDDGGRTRDDDPACDDIVVRMPLPEVKVEGK
jgi:hypothetical protein